MDIQKLLAATDHTLLRQTATWAEIRKICDEGIEYATASVCIPPSFVARARQYAGGRLRLCTVVGFPNGYAQTAVKAYEAAAAVGAGADEVDMVVNLGDVKDGDYNAVLNDIQSVRRACPGQVLKVIVETCLLTREEKTALCGVVTASGADYIKTSTGFSTGGATAEDIALFREHVGAQVRIKAAGGIASLETAQEFLHLGASRLGTSRVVALVQALRARGEAPENAAY